MELNYPDSIDGAFAVGLQHLSNCIDNEMVVIKGQIVVEYELNRYLFVMSKGKQHFNESQFSFFQKCKVAAMFGFPENAA